jgi:caffeoyl-CoA O-methyltransferase
MDMSQEWTDVAKTFWEKDGVASKIELQIGDALESISQLEPGIVFDLVHIDAEKTLYDDFFEAALPKVRSGGVFVFDNMLRAGAVVDQDSDDGTESIKRLNKKLANDPRVETVLLTIGDGIQLCRKK